jgi:hypothetical protein
LAVKPEQHDTLSDDGICSRTPCVRLGDPSLGAHSRARLRLILLTGVMPEIGVNT